MRPLNTSTALACAAWLLGASAAFAQTSVQTTPIGGAVMTADNQTLIVSLPSESKLAYFDPLTGKQTQTVDVSFQPGSLAVQNNRLVTASRDSSIVHVLDAASGMGIRDIVLPRGWAVSLACHPRQGLVYAVSSTMEVFAVDLDQGIAKPTSAAGQMIVVDPAGKHVFTALQPPPEQGTVVQRLRGGLVRLGPGTRNWTARVVKYEVAGDDLRPVAENINLTLAGGSLSVSADGSRLAVAGGGGYLLSQVAPLTYEIALFEAADLRKVVGNMQLGPYPHAVAFHPVLDLVAAYRNAQGGEVALFDAKSFDKLSTTPVPGAAPTGFLLFGGRGTVMIFASVPLGTLTNISELTFIPLKPTDPQRQALEAAYPR